MHILLHILTLTPYTHIHILILICQQYIGMSEAFLNTSHFKLLFVAGVERLDKELIIGQMQGKFQTGILPTVGHAVHEDAPDRAASILVDFLARFKVVTVTK